MPSIRALHRRTLLLPIRTSPHPSRCSFSIFHPIHARKTESSPPKHRAGKLKSKPGYTDYNQRWSPEEEALLLSLREQKLSWQEIMTNFPGRTRVSLVSKYNIIAPRGEGGRYLHTTQFTDAERNLLFKLRAEQVSWQEIHKNHFPDQKLRNLIERWSRTRVGGKKEYGLEYQEWTPADLKKLMRLREKKKMDWMEVSKALGRSSSSTRSTYQRLVKKRVEEGGESDESVAYVTVRSRRNWPIKDEEKLRKMVRNGATRETIAKTFPGWSPQGLGQKIVKAKHLEGIPVRKINPVDMKSVKKMLRLRRQETPWSEIVDLFPQFEPAELKYAYGRAFRLQKEAEANSGENNVGVTTARKPKITSGRKASAVGKGALAKLMRLKAKGSRWKEIVDTMPGFRYGELRYAYDKALRLQEEADKTAEMDV